MKYVIEIPTVEALETLTAVAHRKAEEWVLTQATQGMEAKAKIGDTSFTVELSDCPYRIDRADLNEVQNTLREMGYNTSYYPRREELVVDWSTKGRRELQALKDNNGAWRLPSRKELAEIQARLDAMLGR